MLQNIVVTRYNRRSIFRYKGSNPIRIWATAPMPNERNLVSFAICSNLHDGKGDAI